MAGAAWPVAFSVGVFEGVASPPAFFISFGASEHTDRSSGTSDNGDMGVAKSRKVESMGKVSGTVISMALNSSSKCIVAAMGID
ncbi:hypothetical protein P280DRAFT_473169 [Massarina eburnea CBS 473.64]|uniref:Uncharacterized protein n=1 Tax=Massarina eburnea CBS 473.64 TaxID=1395130 RepID=A0A6A6RMF8_9PLEO|nr:hypothetical protein P280DRAFT_473169 [Massarina eburnea CBS 473.64]